eukprot:scaffold4853_cov105-Isochrysis_galbana.AAC.4
MCRCPPECESSDVSVTDMKTSVVTLHLGLEVCGGLWWTWRSGASGARYWAARGCVHGRTD